MLRELGIRNYALIEETRVQLEPGLTVVTGETGAGKSMMFDALLIALGERAGADRVRPGAERAEIEAVFEQPCTAALEWLQAQDLDDGDDCVVRRVIRGDGRSRLHINGRSASAQQVRELAGLLLDVQGQHAFHGLLSGARQRELLDAYGGHAPLLAEVGAAARTLRTARERLAAWRSGRATRGLLLLGRRRHRHGIRAGGGCKRAVREEHDVHQVGARENIDEALLVTVPHGQARC